MKKTNNKSLMLCLFVGLCSGFFIGHFAGSIKKFILNIFKKSGNDNTILVSSKNDNVITLSEFKNLFNIIQKSDQRLQLISLLTEEEQRKTYTQCIESYVINDFLIKHYLEEHNISNQEDIQNEYNAFIKIVSNSFYSNLFQRKLNEEIIFSPEDAKIFYEKYKEILPEFLEAPFTIEAPGIETQVVKIEDGKKATDYKNEFKAGKENVIKLGRINHSSKNITIDILDKLNNMKDGDIEEITLSNGLKFALHRVKKESGQWNLFDTVKDKVIQIYKVKKLEERYYNTIDSLKAQYKIVINEPTLNILLKNDIKEKEVAQKSIVEKAKESVEEKTKEEIKEVEIKPISLKKEEKDIAKKETSTKTVSKKTINVGAKS